MNRGPDQLFDSRVADWLEADPNAAPDQALEVVLAAVPSIRQRRRGLGLGGWRTNQMTASLKFAVGVAAVLMVAAGGLYLLAPRDAPGVGGAVATPTPSASPSVAPSPSPSAAATPTPIDPATWVPYTSERYGYTLDHPADWTIKPSQSDWQPGTIHSELSQWADVISDPQGGYTIFAGRQDLETGQTPESWTAQYISNKAADAGGAGGVCGDISTERYEQVEIDGETGSRIAMVCVTTFYTAAIVVHDGSAYLVALATVADSGNARAIELFDAVLASFRFAAS